MASEKALLKSNEIIDDKNEEIKKEEEEEVYNTGLGAQGNIEVIIMSI